MMAGVIVALCIACASLFWQNRTLRQQMHGWQATPALRSFWGAFLGDVGETDVVLADTSFALEEDILKTLDPTERLSELRVQTFCAEREVSVPTRGMPSIEFISRNNGSNSDFRAARRVLMLDPLSSHRAAAFRTGLHTGGAQAR